MYSEEDAIAYIRAAIGSEISDLYDDDELLNVIDMIFDYYEQNGMLDIDADDDEPEPDELINDLTDYAARMLRRDAGAEMKPEHLRPIIEAEVNYENSLI